MPKLNNRILATFGVVPAFALHDGNLGTTPFAVYCALCVYANKSGMAWPSQRTIARELKIGDVKTVRRALKELEDLKYITIQKSKARGRGMKNTYHIVDKGSVSCGQPEKKGGISTPINGNIGGIMPEYRGHNLPKNNTKNNKRHTSFFSGHKNKTNAVDPNTGEDLAFIPT